MLSFTGEVSHSSYARIVIECSKNNGSLITLTMYVRDGYFILISSNYQPPVNYLLATCWQPVSHLLASTYHYNSAISVILTWPVYMKYAIYFWSYLTTCADFVWFVYFILLFQQLLFCYCHRELVVRLRILLCYVCSISFRNNNLFYFIPWWNCKFPKNF